MNEIGSVLRSLRGDMPLREVEKLTSVSRSYICRVENGRRNPSAEVLSKLADCYGVDPLFLYKAAGLLPQSEGDALSDIAAVVNAGGKLSSEQVKLLRFVAESMLRDSLKDPTNI